MSELSQVHVAVIGAGPAGLMAAETLARGGATVTVYERMSSVGRKLLLAGRGGLNLTHSEPVEIFLTRYRGAEARLRPAILELTPWHLRNWSAELGQETFVGTSGRVFPKAMKASPLLRAWLPRLADLGVTFKLRHEWLGWGEAGLLRFKTPDGEVGIAAESTVLALGGASWPHLGSDGAWVRPIAELGVSIAPLRPANCGFLVSWSEVFRNRFAGEPLKRIALSSGAESVRGEAVITAAGIEGGAVYALSASLREAVLANGFATVLIDVRPDTSHEDLTARLAAPREKQSLATFLRKAIRLPPPAVGLLQEAAHASGTSLGSLDAAALARLIKAVPVTLSGVAPIARAISTAGGIRLDEIDADFMLKARPGTFVAGEMLDWEAPTGGYLLQACFATGCAAANGALSWLAEARVNDGKGA